jgi:uncharacterized protein YkwD
MTVKSVTACCQLASLSLLCALVLVAGGGRGFAQMDDERRAPLEEITTPFMPLTHALDAGDREAWEWDVVRLVNQERANNGNLPPLKRDGALDAAAYGHSQDMGLNDFFSHTGSDGSSPWDRMEAVGYDSSYAGENIAGGYSSPQRVMQGWMESSGHRANILNSNYREIGVGYYYDSDGSGFGHYWTQNFGRRSAVYPLVINREAYSTTHSTVELYVYGPGDAQQMRFKNDEGDWSPWQPYATDTVWALAEGDSGSRTVYAQVSGGGETYQAQDDILYMPNEPVLNVFPTEMTFLSQGGTGICVPDSYTLHVSNVGGGTLNWDATGTSSWFEISESSDTAEVTCDDNAVGTLGLGTQKAEVIVTADGAGHSPETVSVTLIVAKKISWLYAPFITRER